MTKTEAIKDEILIGKIRQSYGQADDDNYKQLASAIVVQAIKDYKKLLKKEHLKPKEEREKANIERFFKSRWGESLTELDGKFCLRKIEESLRKGKGDV